MILLIELAPLARVGEQLMNALADLGKPVRPEIARHFSVE
jgi:hypothetical protein